MFLLDFLLPISAFGILFAIHQFFISAIFFILRMRKEEVKCALSTFSQDKYRMGKEHVSIGSIFMVCFYGLFLLAIIIVCFFGIFSSKIDEFSIYFVFLVIDVFILMKINKNYLIDTLYGTTGRGLILLKYPKKWMNLFFQPSWSLLFFFIAIILYVIFR